MKDLQAVAHAHDRVLFTVTLEEHGVELKIPVTEHHVLHGSTYVKCPEQANP